jgi:tetratricopeptide (TPR) repeat protein
MLNENNITHTRRSSFPVVSALKARFSQKDVSRLVGISEAQVRYWESTGLIPAVEEEPGTLFFDFRGLAAFRTIRGMMNKGVSFRKIRKAVENFRKHFHLSGQAVTDLSLSLRGKEIVFSKDQEKFTPEGQLFLNFGSIATRPVPLPVDPAEDLFFRALEFERANDPEKALELYSSILSCKPDHADALVNIANLEYRKGMYESAERNYRRALRASPDHPEANFHLGDILEGRDDFEGSILFYMKAIYEDPDYADAYFSAGRACRKLGETAEAKRLWKRFLELRPQSEWQEYIESFLDEA